MTYSLNWRSPALPFLQKQAPISVPAGALVSNAASISFTGKGATNYGKVQQENLLRLLENFAGDTQPDYPTVGQLWYDTLQNILKVCVSTAPGPIAWRQLKGTQISAPGELPPSSPTLGDTWFSQTGSTSGTLYVYTGIGRYPQTDWDAIASGYWPTIAGLKLQADLNTATFGAVGSQYNEFYVHGTVGGLPADVAGSILLDGAIIVIPAGAGWSNFPVVDGLIIVDPTGTLVSTVPAVHKYFVVRQFDDGRWFYDNNSALVEFTPVPQMYAIGVCTVAGYDDNSAPGISSITMWSEAIRLTNLLQVPRTLSAGAIGGWEQIYPTIEVVGGRLEYEYMYGQLAQLIGDPIVYGGSGAEGKSINYLTNFRALDASMHVAYLANTPLGLQVTNDKLNQLKITPSSQDWDALLSACRYAVNRLELPPGTMNDVAVYPFVQDGMAGPDLGFTDSRAIPAARNLRNRVGMMTLISQYQETMNVLRAAINNRYVCRGILGTSGVNSIMLGTTQNMVSYSATAAALPGVASHGLAYKFANTNADLEAFFYSAGAIQLVFTHTPSGAPSAADQALQLLSASSGRIRITGDKTYIMSPDPVPALVAVPNSLGFKAMTPSGVLLGTLTNGGSTIVIRGVRENAWTVAIYIDITRGGVLTGTFSVLWSYIIDGETYFNPVPTLVYPIPEIVDGTSKRGSALFT